MERMIGRRATKPGGGQVLPTDLHMSEGRIGNLFGKFHTGSGQSQT
jgi:hypothetical protein